VSIIDNN